MNIKNMLTNILYFLPLTIKVLYSYKILIVIKYSFFYILTIWYINIIIFIYYKNIKK